MHETETIVQDLLSDVATLNDGPATDPLLHVIYGYWQRGLVKVADELYKTRDDKYELENLRMERTRLQNRIAQLEATLATQVVATSGPIRDRLSPMESETLSRAGSLDTFLYCVKDGQHISAIKLYRQVFGTGLKESKDRVEEIRDGRKNP